MKIPNEIKSLLLLLLVISHEQASAERGFNANKSICKVNLSEKLMVSKKMIIDHIPKQKTKKKTVYYHRLLSSPTSLLSL